MQTCRRSAPALLWPRCGVAPPKSCWTLAWKRASPSLHPVQLQLQPVHPGGEDQLSGSLHSPQRCIQCSHGQQDKLGLPAVRVETSKHISGASMAATGLAQGTSLVHDELAAI